MINWRIRWLGLVNVYYYVHYARQTRTINQVKPYLMEFKSPGGFEIHRVRKYLVNVVLFGIQDLEICKILVKLKGNLYDGPLNIFPNFDTVILSSPCSKNYYHHRLLIPHML